MKKGEVELMEWVVGWVGFSADGNDRRVLLEVVSRHRSSDAARRALARLEKRHSNAAQCNGRSPSYPLHNWWFLGVVELQRARTSSGTLRPADVFKNTMPGRVYVGRERGLPGGQAFTLPDSAFRQREGAAPDIEYTRNHVASAIAPGTDAFPSCVFRFPWR